MVPGNLTAILRACAGALVIGVLTMSASATILVTDGFGDGDRDNNGTTETAATDVTDTGIPWYLCAGTSAVTLGAIDDSSGIGSANALQLFNTASNNRPIAGHLATQALADGDKMIFSFDARLTN